jgi:NAD(P)H-dependent FMN reductase
VSLATKGELIPKLGIILGSTRPGRVGLPVTEWFTSRARQHGGFDIELIDLLEVNLPMDEPKHPRLKQYTHQHTEDWSARIDSANALVMVTPEYNDGFPAPLKNAIDFLHCEWHHKPVGIVSYGGISAGTRSAQVLKQVLTTLRMWPLFEAVSIPFVAQFIHDGRLVANDVLEQAADAMLDELVQMELALRQCRASSF